MSRINARPYELHERQPDGSWEVVSTWESEKLASDDLERLKSRHPLRSYMIVYDDIIRTEKYTDVYGCMATVIVSTDGRANLLVRSDRGAIVHAKTYDSYRGAKIAMGMSGDCWTRTA